MPNNVLTVSRQNCLQRCPRAHYWQFEVGLRREFSSMALRIGSAWARAMESRWFGQDYESALNTAIDKEEFDAYTAATIAGLLIGYYRHYGDQETRGRRHPEVKFSYPLERSRTFTVEGKIDELGTLEDGRTGLIEAKTTGDSLAPESDYWLRLRWNPQVMQYVIAARRAGWQLGAVIYDVTRKPSIRPKLVTDLDANQKKIVIDSAGNRVFKKDGSPRETGDTEKGYTVKTHTETPEEFEDRLIADIASRPDFYFARREVPILDEDLQEFEAQRLMLARMIQHCRIEEKAMHYPESAWPRAVSDQCKFCVYAPFCLQNIHVDPAEPPEGFSIQPFNPELQDDAQQIEEVANG